MSVASRTIAVATSTRLGPTGTKAPKASTAPTKASSGMNTGVVVGVSIAAAVALIALGVGIFFYLRYRRRNKRLESGPGFVEGPQESYHFERTHKKQGSDTSGLAPLLLNSWKSHYSRTNGATVTRSKTVGSFHSKDVDELSGPPPVPAIPSRPSFSSLDDSEWGSHSRPPSVNSYYSTRVVSPAPSQQTYSYQRLDAPLPEVPSLHQPSSSASSPPPLPRLDIPSKQQVTTPAKYQLKLPVATLEVIHSASTPATSTEYSTLNSIESERLRSAIEKFPMPPVPELPSNSSRAQPMQQDPESPASIYSVVDSPVLPADNGSTAARPDLSRGSTTMIGQLLKSRAKRGAELDRELTTSSRIERQDSIREVETPRREELTNSMVNSNPLAFWQPGMGMLKMDADVPQEVTDSPLEAVLYTPWDSDFRRDGRTWDYQPPSSTVTKSSGPSPQSSSRPSPSSSQTSPASLPEKTIAPQKAPSSSSSRTNTPPVPTGTPPQPSASRQLPRVPQSNKPLGPRIKDGQSRDSSVDSSLSSYR